MVPSSGISIRFLGNSGFHISKGGSSILIDPPEKKSGDIDGGLVYCSHRHFDHTGGIAAFMERNPEAVLVTNKQVSKLFKQYEDRIITIYDGDTYQHNGFNFQFIKSKHGFLNPLNIGVIIREDGFSFGHPGDTASFQGFYQYDLDWFAVPIIGLFTSSPSRALAELKKFNVLPGSVVVMHWWYRDPVSFCKKLSRELPEVRCIVPENGKLENSES
jgi:L-ascorbate metabolism protein UlaG (beta-lactamase superfamily)